MLGIAFRTPEAVQGIGFVVLFPLVFASSTFVPVGTMPAWLQVISKHSPITAVADAVRALSLGGSFSGTTLVALGWLAAIVVIAGAGSAVLYRRLAR